MLTNQNTCTILQARVQKARIRKAIAIGNTLPSRTVARMRAAPQIPERGSVCEYTLVNHFAVAGASLEENACNANTKVHTIVQSKHTHTSRYKCMQYTNTGTHSRYVSTGSVRGLQRPPPEQTPGGHLLWEPSWKKTSKCKSNKGRYTCEIED